MDNNIKWFYDEMIERTKKALERNNYDVYVLESAKDLTDLLGELIEEGSTVSMGGSMTLNYNGVIEFLRKGNYNFLDRAKEGLTPEDINRIYRETFFADYYLTSSNAITENGELVNLDGNGNRVAAMIYGPKKVVVVAGYNKIVKDIDEAYTRVRDYASPINAKRLNRSTPCVKTGECMDCASDARICNHLVLTYRQNVKGRGIVVLVKEELGY